MPKLTVRDLSVHGNAFSLRVDYNVPLEEKNGQMVITDLNPDQRNLPRSKLLIDRAAKLSSPPTRPPKGQRNPRCPSVPWRKDLLTCLGTT